MEQSKWRDLVKKLGWSIDDTQFELLIQYRDWLAAEAIPAGGLGKHEHGKLDDRHIVDSLLFAYFISSETPEVWDLGSGAGLPGIPLAILRPETRFHLIDRSQRKVDLLKRVVRVLGLANVNVLQIDIEQLEDRVGLIVSRATLPPKRAFRLVEPLLTTTGVAVLGGSWIKEPHYRDWETVDVGSEVLDQPVWLLIMHRR